MTLKELYVNFHKFMYLKFHLVNQQVDGSLLFVLLYINRLSTLEGHRASDWPKEPNWTGKLKIVSRGKTCMIVLFDENNQTFALCKVTDDTAVERTLDSGRYFVLRITNPQGRHAFIGIAFNERNDAFDFNVALSEFKNELDREAQALKFFDNGSAFADLSLKHGEKIKIKLVKEDQYYQSHTSYILFC